MQFFLPQPPQQPGPFKAALNAFIAEELVLTAPWAQGGIASLQNRFYTRQRQADQPSGSRAGCELLPTPSPPDQCRRPRRKKERRGRSPKTHKGGAAQHARYYMQLLHHLNPAFMFSCAHASSSRLLAEQIFIVLVKLTLSSPNSKCPQPAWWIIASEGDLRLIT
jgi:hypothetical protein